MVEREIPEMELPQGHPFNPGRVQAFYVLLKIFVNTSSYLLIVHHFVLLCIFLSNYYS